MKIDIKNGVVTTNQEVYYIIDRDNAEFSPSSLANLFVFWKKGYHDAPFYKAEFFDRYGELVSSTSGCISPEEAIKDIMEDTFFCECCFTRKDSAYEEIRGICEECYAGDC